jgi:cobalt-zinc-cadmium efflux system protein
VNSFSAWWLHRPAKGGNINMQGAYLHVLGDLLGSVAAIASALGVRYLGWLWLDPVLSLLVAVLLLKSAWHLVRESSIILLEWCPRHLSIPAIETSLLEQPGVLSVHDLHVWGVGSQQWALSAHVVVEPAYTGAEQLHHLYTVLNQRYGLRHQTIQLETPGYRARALNDGFHEHQ